MRNELYHHGVKGQKWGVRNGPPYPIEDNVMRKGHKLNSISDYLDPESYRKNGKAMYTYNPDDEWDSKVYKGPFSAYLAMYRGKRFLIEHKYEVIKDLKMPTRKQRVDEFKNLYSDKKYRKDLLKTLENTQKTLVQYKIGNPKEQEAYSKVNLKKLNTPADWDTAYSVFNHAMEASYAHKSTQEYMRRMASKYDAMVDDNNQGVYNDAHDPVVIFRANEALKTIGSQPISILDIRENYASVQTELAKTGKKVKL